MLNTVSLKIRMTDQKMDFTDFSCEISVLNFESFHLPLMTMEALQDYNLIIRKHSKAHKRCKYYTKFHYHLSCLSTYQFTNVSHKI